MKKIFFLTLFSTTLYITTAQQSDIDKPVYLRFPEVPAFTVYKAPDSTAFSRGDIKKKKQVVFFIFSPDCGHCNDATKAITKNINRLKDVEIIMVTYLPYTEMMDFYNKHQLRKYSNITVARDTKLFFPAFFKVKYFPSYYIYDKKGKFKKFLEGDVDFELVMQALNS